MHSRFGDVFDDDWNIVVPDSNRLVVRRRDESTVLIDEIDRVDLARRKPESDIGGRESREGDVQLRDVDRTLA